MNCDKSAYDNLCKAKKELSLLTVVEHFSILSAMIHGGKKKKKKKLKKKKKKNSFTFCDTMDNTMMWVGVHGHGLVLTKAWGSDLHF